MTNPLKGNYGYVSIIHEIGHALGFDHPHGDAGIGNHFGNLAAPWDSSEFTVMTYRAFSGAPLSVNPQPNNYPQSLMALDIAALQHLYGVSHSNSGFTTYKWNPANGNMEINGVAQNAATAPAANVVYRTIWDGGGVDTYDFSLYATNLLVDLSPGSETDPNAGWTVLDTSAVNPLQRANLGNNTDGTIHWARGNIANARLFQGDGSSLIENAVGGSGNDRFKGNAAPNNFQGNGGNDTMEGFGGADILNQGGGGGEMYGGDDFDLLIAGPGAEIIDGGNHFDTVSYANSANGFQIDTTIGKVVGGWATGDTLISIEAVIGSAFDDAIAMGDEQNRISAGEGWDTLSGGGGNDQLEGEGGNDVIRGGAGGDIVNGAGGFDTATFGAAVTVNLASGIHGGEAVGDLFISIEQFNGSADGDVMVANNSAGARFVGGDGVDQLFGADLNDWLQGGKGADHINGGNGSDIVSYADATNAIIAELYFNDGTTDGKITAGDWGLDTLISIENIEGTNFADVILGDERANAFWGLGGDDDMEGDAGSSSPPASNDSLFGGAGNDTLNGGGGFDYLEGGAGNDIFYVDSDFDQVREAAGGGYDQVLASATFTLHSTLAEVELLATSNAASTVAIALTGSNFNNTIIGNAGDNLLSGRDGDDFLYTGAGVDTMDGGNGHDTMVFHRAMVADWQAGVLDAEIASDSWANWEAIQGSAGDDRIRTNSWGFSVELQGGDGDDVLATGVTGVVADILRGEIGDDDLNGGAGGDKLFGGQGRDIADGGYGNDLVDGGAGRDRLLGGPGRDRLIGGEGEDALRGGLGADRFDFNALVEIGKGADSDIIYGFESDQSDRLDLSTIDANAVLNGDQGFVFLTALGATFTGAGQVRFRQQGGDTFVDLNTNNNLTTVEATVKLAGLVALDTADIIL